MFGFDGFGFFAPTSVIWIAINWIIRISALFVVPRNRKPTAGTAWLMVIFLFPIGGIILFWVLSSPKLPKSRRDSQRTLDGIIARIFEHFKSIHDIDNAVPEQYVPVETLSESLAHLPALGGNKLDILPEYDDAIKKMIRDINKAEHFVHLEYFIIALDDITEPLFVALADAVKRDVVVRVMYDSFATRRYPNFRKMRARLQADGVLVQPILPFRLPGRGYVRPDLRNHRKVLVVDGTVGYTGSLNLIQRDYHRKDDIYYDELVVRVRGPVVMELLAVFISDWYSETGVLLSLKDLGIKHFNPQNMGSSVAQVLPSGPGYESENNLKLFTDLIHGARKNITITNPYFVPDDALTTAITTAVKRGVEVISYDPKVVAELRAVENTYLLQSHQIQLVDWQQRPLRKVLLDNLARLTSALQ
jgi:cardiolipin synthase